MNSDDENKVENQPDLPLTFLRETFSDFDASKVSELGIITIKEFVAFLATEDRRHDMANYLNIELDKLQLYIETARELLGDEEVNKIENIEIKHYKLGAIIPMPEKTDEDN